jgi:hypothetical protein
VNRNLQKLLRRSILAVCGTVLAVATAAAPARADDVDTQAWGVFTVQKELSPRWRAYFEVQPRFGQDVNGLERLLVRPAIGYRIRPNLSVWQGYGWTPLVDPTFVDEHRLFQQLLYEDNLGKASVSNRVRLEERFIEHAGGTALRFRNMLRVSHPISADKKWALVGFDEFFWNLNSTTRGPVSGFDQNRLFFGISRQLNPQVRLETGYLLDLINSPRGKPNRQLNVWMTSVALKL